jgi:hypothetical protein
MKKMTGIIILALWLLSWQGVAVAANWLFVQRLEGTRMGVCDEYINDTSVVRAGDKLIFWTLRLYEKPFGKQQAQRVLYKNEAILAPAGQVRTVEYYHYNQAGTEVLQYLKPMMFSPLEQSYAAQRALQYARDSGELLSDKPLDIEVSPPLWQSVEISSDQFTLWIDTNSIKLLSPTDGAPVSQLFEITAKRIWSEQAAAVRQNELMRRDPAKHSYAGLAYQVVTYRFHRDAEKMIVLLITDHNLHGVPMAFATETDWRQVMPDSFEAKVGNFGRDWLKTRAGI